MNIFKHKTLNVIADQPAHEMMETDPDADISLDPTLHTASQEPHSNCPFSAGIIDRFFAVAVFVKVTQQRGACVCVNGKAGVMDQGCVDDF